MGERARARGSEVEEGEDFVFCRVCDMVMREISWNHLRKHSLTLTDYRAQFPDAPIRCGVLAEKMKENDALHSQRMKGDGNPFHGRHHAYVSKKRMSKSHKENYLTGRESWKNPCRPKGESHPRWKANRGELVPAGSRKHIDRRNMLRFHGHKCMVPGCGFDFIVENHHIVPRSEKGGGELPNCILLCPNHHALADAEVLSRETLAQISKNAIATKEEK